MGGYGERVALIQIWGGDIGFVPDEIFGKISLQRLGCPPHPGGQHLISQRKL